MDNQSNVKFSFTVPFNNEDIIQSRNKNAKCALIASSLFALFLIIAAVVMLNILSYDYIAWFLFYLFSGVAFFSLATAIIYLVVSKKTMSPITNLSNMIFMKIMLKYSKL